MEFLRSVINILGLRGEGQASALGVNGEGQAFALGVKGEGQASALAGKLLFGTSDLHWST